MQRRVVWMLSGLVFAACASVDPSAEPAAAGPTTSTTAAPVLDAPVPTIPNQPSAAVIRKQRRYHQVEPLGDLQEGFGIAPALLGPGVHSTEMLGGEVTLTLTEWWRLDFAVPGRLDLVDPENPIGDDLPSVSVLRPTGWFDDAQVARWASMTPGRTPEYEPADVETWLRNSAALSIIDSGKSGVFAWWDLTVISEVESVGCPQGRPVCVPLTVGGGSLSMAFPDERHRLFVQRDVAQPVAVLVRSEVSSTGILSRAARLVDGLDLTAVGAHPTEAAAFPWSTMVLDVDRSGRTAAIPGLVVEVDAGQTLRQRPGRVTLDEVSVDRPLWNYGSAKYTSADEIIREFHEPRWRLEVEERPPETFLGTEARVFDLAGGPSRIVLIADTGPADGGQWAQWLEQPFARVWIVDTVLGPLLYSVQAETSLQRDARAQKLAQLARSFRIPCAGTDSCAVVR